MLNGVGKYTHTHVHVVHLRLSTAIVPLVGFMVGFTVVVASPSSATVVLLPGALLCQIHLILELHNTRTGKYIIVSEEFNLVVRC